MTKEEAILILTKMIPQPQRGDGKSTTHIMMTEALAMAIKALEQAPKTGHWIALGNYDDYGNESSYKCSGCGDIDTYSDNFCPNCGSYMIGIW